MKLKFVVPIVLLCIILGCQTNEPENGGSAIKETETFESGSYTMLGQKGKIGFIKASFSAQEEQKYMWHFWGDDEELKGSFRVEGKQEETGRTITVVEADGLGGPNNGADAHIPSIMSLPDSGKWHLDAYVGDQLFGTITINVSE
ncbi:DUF4871 domain-containing protein [Halobacillus litoralis]|uniref:DUF4871 domain-containing protein n=1 Tax=Halobacillus litoralis TaxID=45668 RepID=UPI001CFD9844|nr:DUF4871 domain-containing protein [Halobacillus litoralis]